MSGTDFASSFTGIECTEVFIRGCVRLMTYIVTIMQNSGLSKFVYRIPRISNTAYDIVKEEL